MAKYTESGMVFSFPKKEIFRLEDDSFVSHIQHASLCDFVWRTNDKNKSPITILIEAKSSSPDFSRDDNTEDKAAFLHKIRNKFLHSLLIYLRCTSKYFRSNLCECPIDQLKADYSFVLIVRDHDPAWCQLIMDKLNVSMIDILKSFGVKKMIVINKEHAIRLRIPITN